MRPLDLDSSDSDLDARASLYVSASRFRAFLASRLEGGGFGALDGAEAAAEQPAVAAEAAAAAASAGAAAATVRAAVVGVDVDEVASTALTLELLRARGLPRPVRVTGGRAGLGMRVPRPEFAVRDVARAVGRGFPVSVMDVRTQGELHGWTMGRWSDYFHAEIGPSMMK